MRDLEYTHTNPYAHLSVQCLSWCRQHGTPVLGLRVDAAEDDAIATSADELIWLTLSPDDARAMSALQSGEQAARARLYDLLDALLEWLDSDVRDVELSLDTCGTLRATLRVLGYEGAVAIPAHSVDAVIIAWRRQIPLRMPESDLRRIRALRDSATGHAGQSARIAADGQAPPEAFRRFIESLELDLG
jgi:bifunctional DNase/RNase